MVARRHSTNALNRALTPDAQATFGWPFSFALNRLLEAEPWARERLAPFAGQVLELRAPPLPSLRFVILPGGTLEAGGGDPALVITLTPEALPALLKGEEHFMRAVQVAGDERLATQAMALLRHLRWDAEEDLSKLVGDVAAHRLMNLARGFAAWQADAARRLAGAAADYAVEEKRVLVASSELEAFASEVSRLRDALERLDKRVRGVG
jgi:ubiquinone biosynthesis accessory factor UbiJ